MTLAPLFTWRSAICESDLAPTARHVALALSLYMNERGGSAFPGAARLAADTGLHVSTVRAHLGVLVEGGWLRVASQGGLRGETRSANAYEARIPATKLPLADDDPSSRTTRRPRRATPRPGRRVPLVLDARPLVLDDPNSPLTLQESYISGSVTRVCRANAQSEKEPDKPRRDLLRDRIELHFPAADPLRVGDLLRALRGTENIADHLIDAAIGMAIERNQTDALTHPLRYIHTVALDWRQQRTETVA